MSLVSLVRFSPPSHICESESEFYTCEGGRKTHQTHQTHPPAVCVFFLTSSIPTAILASHALDRDIILACDESALEALTEADPALPVLFFAECEGAG